jgi:hypothetical protein
MAKVSQTKLLRRRKFMSRSLQSFLALMISSMGAITVLLRAKKRLAQHRTKIGTTFS